MAWLSENWIWVFFGLAFVAMHMFGHGGHGGGGGHCGHGGHEDEKKPMGEKANSAPTADKNNVDHTHRH
ncbi:MAG: DUF2933 domain-containing protein [Gammaproteobacteria bacterium]|nr:DUF2933 domain-containing protein [Gammaproteobacteria bacterium]MBU0786561.1 DUF2933 domain-containing protein [Gammaproteobacteria bacterium]MBU0817169.1 DUF2933 domain-containing protein [Gammaproteobacteria bacterium]MBU1787710.1 DUF2933 domain-containing protein [Gammaproteobacteria bacterium]